MPVQCEYSFEEVKPRRTCMTFWSKSDPMRHVSGVTDHWTKLKRRAEEQAGILPSGSGKQFDCYLYKSLGCQPPGLYHATLPKTQTGKETYLRSSFHQRAKQGFVYWRENKAYPVSKCAFAPENREIKPEADLNRCDQMNCQDLQEMNI